jgi:hypothetical protein
MTQKPIVDTQTQIIAAVVGLAVSVSAAAIEKRANSCVYTCGSTCYWQSDIDAALNKGYSLYSSGKEEGESSSLNRHWSRDREVASCAVC